MKKNIILLFASFAALLFAGCGSSGETTPSNVEFTGEWHLVQWCGAAPTEFDAYVVFNEDRTFVIYQQIEQIDYQTFKGQWAYDGVLLSGRYDDGTLWGSDYEAALDEAGDTLTLTSRTSVPEVGVYRRASVPDEIRKSAVSATASRTETRRLL